MNNMITVSIVQEWYPAHDIRVMDGTKNALMALDSHGWNRGSILAELISIREELGTRTINPYVDYVEAASRVPILTLGSYLYSARCVRDVVRTRRGNEIQRRISNEHS